ncbi:MAG: aspartate--tRNA(Asn) ligase [Candidatus Hydrothermarchaeota archaeon]|nr:aspartate--tRNA(Asn) ligase [Candidatus Hydrothermarchaeota archaeon]
MRKYSNEITPENDGSTVTVAGWAHEIRDLGGLRFILLRDRAGLVQVTLPKKFVSREVFETSRKISKESVISVTGKVKAEEKAPNGYEVIPGKIEILGIAAAPLPLDPTGKVGANIDTRLDARVMDLRRVEISAIFKIRDEILQAGREYLRSAGFIEIQTPRIISTSSEGGTELFPVAYFEREAFLAQSPQLYKQMLMAAGFDRVYEIATYFRAEEHNTVWHLNEITAIDCELAFIDSEENVMHVIENLAASMISAARERCRRQLEILGKDIAEPKLPFPRIRYDEALKMLEGEGIKVPFGEDLTTETEKKVGEIMRKKGIELYFITKYPLKIKPFYTMPDKDSKHSNSFDLEYKGREVVSGSQRVHDYESLVKRIKAKGLKPENFTAYLESFKYGMPPHGGFGLGMERFLMQLLDLQNIREAVLFPRDRKRLTP